MARSGAGGVGGVVEPGSARSTVRKLGRHRFEGESDAPRRARWWLADLLRRHGLQHELHDVMVMVSELTTNAVQHGGGGFEIAAWSDGDDLRVEVADTDPSVPQMQWVPAGATSGRGLLIVETLSDAWGVDARAGGGKTVWFELRSIRTPVDASGRRLPRTS